jgi:hypothetical protein
MKKKSLLGSASSPVSLAVAINPVDLTPVHRHDEKHAGNAHGPKPTVAATPTHATDKPKKAATPNPAHAFRGASRGS